jgi:hypothetical protein
VGVQVGRAEGKRVMVARMSRGLSKHTSKKWVRDRGIKYMKNKEMRRKKITYSIESSLMLKIEKC